MLLIFSFWWATGVRMWTNFENICSHVRFSSALPMATYAAIASRSACTCSRSQSPTALIALAVALERQRIVEIFTESSSCVNNSSSMILVQVRIALSPSAASGRCQSSPFVVVADFADLGR